jgi:phenylacetate-CoA ligase
MYHFYPQYGYTELLPTGLKRDDGKEVYEIVATGFNNSVMPLIRYRTGDYAVLPESQKCSCGRNYLLIDEIIGREQEFVIDVNGTVISATSLIFGQHYEAFVGLESIQIHQNKPGEMEVVLVKGDGYQDRFLHLMKEKMGSLLGERMNICFSFTDAVNKSPIGKAKLVNQELDVRQFLQ